MRAYALLLHVYPASFRYEYGEEMRALFARRRREASSAPASRRSGSGRSRKCLETRRSSTAIS